MTARGAVEATPPPVPASELGRVDVHQHLWPEPFLAALARRTSPPCLRGNTLELPTEPGGQVDLEAHTLENRLRALDRDRIDVALVSLPPTLGVEALPAEERKPLLDAYHEGMLELERAAGGRLRALAVGSCRDGFAGASLPAAALVHDGERIEPLLAELERRGNVLFVHPGPPSPAPPGAPPWWPSIVDYTAQMQAAYTAWLARGAEAHPRLRVVFAILAGGAPVQLERLRSRGVEVRTTLHPNVYLDVASYGHRALELCLATYGVRQLVYGSDVPVIDPQPTLHALASFGDAVVDAVVTENAAFLLADRAESVSGDGPTFSGERT